MVACASCGAPVRVPEHDRLLAQPYCAACWADRMDDWGDQLRQRHRRPWSPPCLPNLSRKPGLAVVIGLALGVAGLGLGVALDRPCEAPGPAAIAPPPPPSPSPSARIAPVSRATPPRVLRVGFSDADYPPSAARREAEGVSRVQLRIGPNGRMNRCTVSESSGHRDLDAAACRLLRRSTFDPARDTDGRAITDTLTIPINWRLTD